MNITSIRLEPVHNMPTLEDPVRKVLGYNFRVEWENGIQLAAYVPGDESVGLPPLMKAAEVLAQLEMRQVMRGIER